MVPGAEFAGFVAPNIVLAVATTPSPSQHMATTGPDLIYSINPGKNGLS